MLAWAKSERIRKIRIQGDQRTSFHRTSPDQLLIGSACHFLIGCRGDIVLRLEQDLSVAFSKILVQFQLHLRAGPRRQIHPSFASQFGAIGNTRQDALSGQAGVVREDLRLRAATG